MKLSIIIPVLNEAQSLPIVLKALQIFRQSNHEIVVVDGGSSDDTIVLASDGADTVITSKLGRAIQMNSGAAVANGDVFLFLHADTVLPEDTVKLIAGLGSDSFWGYFPVRLSGHKIIFRLIEGLMNFRSRTSCIATGDQAIFIERELFKRIGGFPEIALMEDIAISRTLKKNVPPVCFKSKVLTSSRRWEESGIMATVLLMWKLRFLYFIGVSPDKLNQLYR